MDSRKVRLLPLIVWLAWLTSISGCASSSLDALPPVAAHQVQLPPLPVQAQPAPLPSWCLETGATSCSMRLQQLFERWLQPSTMPAPGTPSAPPPTPQPVTG